MSLRASMRAQRISENNPGIHGCICPRCGRVFSVSEVVKNERPLGYHVRCPGCGFVSAVTDCFMNAKVKPDSPARAYEVALL